MLASLHTATLATRRVTSVGSIPGLIAYLHAASFARRQDSFLAGVDDRSLADIGPPRDRAVQEPTPPMWDISANWRGRLRGKGRVDCISWHFVRILLRFLNGNP